MAVKLENHPILPVEVLPHLKFSGGAGKGARTSGVRKCRCCDGRVKCSAWEFEETLRGIRAFLPFPP